MNGHQEISLPPDETQNCREDNQDSRNVFHQIMKNMLHAIHDDDVNSLTELFVQVENLIKDEKDSESYNDSGIATQLQETNLVILACKLIRPNVLRYLFANEGMFSRIVGEFPPPEHEDEQHHNAFYYAVRNGNVDVLKTLTFKWPGCNFSERSKEFNSLLLRAHCEVKVKNLEISQEVNVFTKIILLYNHYHSKSCSPSSNAGVISNTSTVEQIEMIIEHINFIVSTYNDKEIDDVCLLSFRFIAHSLYNLGDFKSVHTKLPCQEIIFLLLAFTQAEIYNPDQRLIYCSLLSKRELLKYLNHFSESLARNKGDLQSTEDSNTSSLSHNMRHNKQTSMFLELNCKYSSIKNVFALGDLKCYLEAVKSAGTQWEFISLLLTRCLQVLRVNIIEFPKLTPITCEFLLQAVSTSTRDILLCKCNPKLYVSSMSKSSLGFHDLFKDMCKLGHILTNLLNETKIQALIRLLEKVVIDTCVKNVLEILEVLDSLTIDDTFLPHSDMRILKQVQKFIVQLNLLVTEKTLYEEELLNDIQEILNKEKSNKPSQNDEMAIAMLQYLKFYIRGKNMTEADFIHIKHTAHRILLFIEPQKVCGSVKSMIEMTIKLWNSVVPRMQDGVSKLYTIILQILKITELQAWQTPWINEAWKKLNKTCFVSKYANGGTTNDFQCKHVKVASKSITENIDVILKLVPSLVGYSGNFLHQLEMSNELINDFLYYQNNKCVQAVIESLVIDEFHAINEESIIINPLSFQKGSILQRDRLNTFLSEGFLLSHTYLSDLSVIVFINAIFLCHALPSGKQKQQELPANTSVKTFSNHEIDKNTVANQKNMFTALTKGELEIVEKCIKRGADINGRNCKLWSSLHFAAKGGSVEAVKYLLNQNMGVNIKDMNGQSPLHIAAQYGRKNIVDYLINETDISVNETDNMSKTPFLYAIQNGFDDIVSIFLKNGTDLISFGSATKPSISKIFYEKSADILSPQEAECNYNAVNIFISLYSAAGSGCTKLIDYLWANKFNIKIKHDILGTPLHMAAENGFVHAVEYLISKGASVDDQNKEGCTPLHVAVRNGHEQVVKLLLEEGSNVNIMEKTLNYTPLRYAVNGGYTRIIKLLLEKGAMTNDLCLEGLSSLHSAVIKGNINAIHILIKNGASVNATSKDGSTSLHLSALKDNEEIFAFLIRNGGNVNAQNVKNETVLHVASENGCQQVCRILLTEDVNVNAEDVHGFTPLHLSCRKGHIGVVRLLLEKGADVKARDKLERTALHFVAMFDIFNVIEILVEKGININCRDKNGFTALHWASLKGNQRSVEKLMRKNANVNATDLNSVSSLHLAVLGNHTDIVKILIENGSFIDAKVSSDNSCLSKGTINWVEMFQKEVLELMLKDVPDLQSMFLRRYGNKWGEGTRFLTPLYLAEYNNNPAITSLLLSKGAKIWVRGSLCLMTSTYFGYKEIVKIMLEKSRSQIAPKNDIPNCLFAAAFKGHVEIVNLLLSMGFSKMNSSTLLCSPLYAAAERGHYEIVKLLLDKNANPNLIDCFGTTPLHRAAALGHKKIVELFLESKVVPAHSRDLVDTTPLEQAAAGGFVEIAKMLLKDRKVNINEKGKDDYTVLHIAAQEGRLEMVKFLVSKKANVTACNSKGSKPIHVAAREGHIKVVEFFLNLGLGINIRGHCEQTCLHYAVQTGQSQTVNFLLEQNIDVNVPDVYGITALHLAAMMCYKNLVIVLLQNGAFYNVVDKINKANPLQMARNEDMSNIFLAVEKLFRAVKIDSLSLVEESIQDGVIINAKNKDNVTALLLAAWKGFTSIVDILLRNSANPNIPGKGGCSPLHYATKFSHLKVVKILLANGAVYNFKNNAQKTPLNISVNPDIMHLLTLIDQLFTYAESGDKKLISELKIIQDVDSMKAILNACNERKEKLIDCANHNKYPFIDELQKICNASVPMNLAKELFGRKKYAEGLDLLFKR